MPAISLASYTIRVSKKRERQLLTLSQFEKNHDLLTVFEKYLKIRVGEPSVNESSKKMLQLLKLNRTDRELVGTLQTGEWGYQEEFRNVHSGVKTYQKGTDEAGLIPFYFLVSIPQNADEGIVILQRFGTKGVRNILLDDFNTYFGYQFSEFSIHINPLAPGKMFDEYLSGKGRLTAIKLTRFEIPDDLADSVGLGHDEKDAYLEISIKAKKNRSLNVKSLKGLFESRKSLGKLVEVHDPNQEKLRVEIEINKKKRTIDVDNRHALRAYIDISDEVKLRSGHPIFESIDPIARGLLSDLESDLKRKAQ
jgi:hypothetical protein